MEEELEGWEATDAPLDGYASEGELDTRKLIAKKNKKKKSGGFQVMCCYILCQKYNTLVIYLIINGIFSDH